MLDNFGSLIKTAVGTNFWRCVLLFAGLAASAPTQDAFAEKYGGIDIGSTGIKRVVMTIDGDNVDMIPGSEVTEDLGLAGALKPGKGNAQFFDDATLKEAVDIIKEHITKMRAPPHSVKKVFAVVSSGLADTANRNDPNEAASKQLINHLNKAELEIDTKVIRVTSKDEATLTFNEIVKKDAIHAFVIDVGGGNTKLASFEAGNAVDFGAKSLAKQLDDPAQQADTASVASAIDERLQTFPSLNSVATIYLSGGPAYIIASLMRPDALGDDPKGLHSLDLKDFNKQLKLIADAKNREDIFDEVKNRTSTPKGEENLQNAKGIPYTLPQLQAGAYLLGTTVNKVIKERSENVTLQFYGNGQTAWIRQWVVREAKKSDDAKVEIDPNAINLLEGKLELLRENIELHEQRLRKLEVNGPPVGKVLPSPQLDDLISKLSVLKNLTYLEKLSDLDKLANLERIDGRLARLSDRLDDSLTKVNANLTRMESTLSEKLDKLVIVTKPAELQQPPPPVTKASSRSYYFEGLAAGRRRQWKSAIDCFDRSLILDTTNAIAWYYRGICLLHVGHNAEALVSISQAGKLIRDDYILYCDTCRTVEHIQGPVRQHAERLLTDARLVDY